MFCQYGSVSERLKSPLVMQSPPTRTSLKVAYRLNRNREPATPALTGLDVLLQPGYYFSPTQTFANRGGCICGHI